MSSIEFGPLHSLLTTPASMTYEIDLKAPNLQLSDGRLLRAPYSHVLKVLRDKNLVREKYYDDCFLSENSDKGTIYFSNP